MNQITKSYKRAFVEVEAVLSCLNIEEYNKIPKELIYAIKNNKDEEYNYEYDSKLNYENWNLMVETKAILYIILKKYLATEEQKEYLKKREQYSITISEKMKKEKYNPDNLFKNINKKEDVENNNLKLSYDLTEYKESFFIKIKKFILKLLHLRN